MKESDTSPRNEFEEESDQAEPTFHLEFPRIDSVDDLGGRNKMLPGYVLVTAALVSPITRMVDALTDVDCRGELARSLELALVGFDERDFRILYSALRQLVSASISAAEQEMLAQHGIVTRLRQLADVFAAAEEAEAKGSPKQKGKG